MSYSLWGSLALAALALSFGVAGGWEMHAVLARPWNGCAFSVAKTALPPQAQPEMVPSPNADRSNATDWRPVTDY